jgi:hypothetical protein
MTNRVKTGGRAKGVSNHVTSEIRQSIANLLESNFSNLQNDLDKLTPGTRLKVLIEFYKMILPKVIDIEDNQSNFTPITVHLIKDNNANNK